MRLGSRVGGRPAVERSSVRERSANREDNAECHSRGQDRRHGGDDSLDSIFLVGGLSDEPEDDVDEVNDEDGSVEVKAITEHQLPVRDLLNGQGLERPVKREDESGCVEDGREDPINPNPVTGIEFRSGDASLSAGNSGGGEDEWHRSVESTRDAGDDDLSEEESSQANEEHT